VESANAKKDLKEYCVKFKNVLKIVVDVENVSKVNVRVTTSGWDLIVPLQRVKMIVQVFLTEIVSWQVKRHNVCAKIIISEMIAVKHYVTKTATTTVCAITSCVSVINSIKAKLVEKRDVTTLAATKECAVTLGNANVMKASQEPIVKKEPVRSGVSTGNVLMVTNVIAMMGSLESNAVSRNVLMTV